MEHIRTKPMVTLALAVLILALFAASRLTSGPRGPVCVEAAPVQPGFTALSARPGPACIRIRLP
jgi:hypothetical protein